MSDGPAPATVDANDAAWRRFYSAASVVAEYRDDQRLQPAEVTIFSLIAADLATARLLDVGVGGGRTTQHLAGVCRDYTAIDYSDAMVEVCRQRYRDAPWYAAERFRQADARALPFADQSFDIVLFSFNGLDHVPPDARATALAECSRVLKPGGWFIYSGHNLNWLDGSGLLPRRAGWRTWWREHRYRDRMRRLNAGGPSTLGVDTAHLMDPPDGLRLYYARPVAHLRELQAAGLTDPRVFDGRGREITQDPAMRQARDTWLYYLARRSA